MKQILTRWGIFMIKEKCLAIIDNKDKPLKEIENMVEGMKI